MTFLIAEIGVNHKGRVGHAKRLIECAIEAGADAAKFQYFDAEKLGNPSIRHLQLSLEQLRELKDYCGTRIEFMCTAFDADGLKEIVPLIRRIKVSSGMIFRRDFLAEVARHDRPLIVSTGMATEVDIHRALEILRSRGAGEIQALLHCVSAYPTPTDQANLRAMQRLREQFGTAVGYSDHTGKYEALIAAASMGAAVIEAHITVDKGDEGPDHSSSHEPQDYIRTVKAIRRIERMMGDGSLDPRACELKTRAGWASD